MTKSNALRCGSFILILIVAYITQRFRQTKSSVELLGIRDVFNHQDISLNLTVIGTNDLHSTFNGYGLQYYSKFALGGYSRLVWLINEIRNTQESKGGLTLTLDAGDWYSGSLFDNLAANSLTTSIPQLQFFADAKFDAIILGNHDFDHYESALYTMFDKAHKLNLGVNIIASNLKPFPENSKFTIFNENSSSVNIIPYLIKENSNGRVGILGYMTPDALFVSDDYRDDFQFIGFSRKHGPDMASLVNLVKEQSAMLKMHFKCDLVVIVAHGGHRDGENEVFAHLPDVDIVLGGHTHERYFFRTRPSGSFISQCDYSGRYLTSLSVGYNRSNKSLVHIGVDGKYESYVEPKSSQCIKINSYMPEDKAFNDKITHWKEEISQIYKYNPDRIVFKGNLSHLFNNKITHNDNAKVFADMLTLQYNKWEQRIKPGSNRTMGIFWNKDFLEVDQLVNDSHDIILTYSDAYNLIFFTATKQTYSFYMHKFHLYLCLQGVFLLQKLVSPLLTICLGGIHYKEDMYLGIPLITDMHTTDNVPYDQWPQLIKVTMNSVVAPFFWKIDKFSYGLFNNFPLDHNGNSISLKEAEVHNSPNEIELFLSYLLEH